MERQTYIDIRSIRILVSLFGAIIAPFLVLKIYVDTADRMRVFLDLPTDTPTYILAIGVGVLSVVIMPISLRARVIATVVYLPIIVVLTFMFTIGLVCGLGVGRCL